VSRGDKHQNKLLLRPNRWLGAYRQKNSTFPHRRVVATASAEPALSTMKTSNPQGMGDGGKRPGRRRGGIEGSGQGQAAVAICGWRLHSALRRRVGFSVGWHARHIWGRASA